VSISTLYSMESKGDTARQYVNILSYRYAFRYYWHAFGFSGSSVLAIAIWIFVWPFCVLSDIFSWDPLC